MTLLCRVLRVIVRHICQWQNCFWDKRGCPYGQPKCSKDSYLVVRGDFWLSWTTGQPLLRTLTTNITGAMMITIFFLQILLI